MATGAEPPATYEGNEETILTQRNSRQKNPGSRQLMPLFPPLFQGFRILQDHLMNSQGVLCTGEPLTDPTLLQAASANLGCSPLFEKPSAARAREASALLENVPSQAVMRTDAWSKTQNMNLASASVSLLVPCTVPPKEAAVPWKKGTRPAQQQRDPVPQGLCPTGSPPNSGGLKGKCTYWHRRPQTDLRGVWHSLCQL